MSGVKSIRRGVRKSWIGGLGVVLPIKIAPAAVKALLRLSVGRIMLVNVIVYVNSTNMNLVRHRH